MGERRSGEWGVRRRESSRDVYAVLKASKVFALPSQREGFGISVVEAKACGISAVVATAPYSTAVDLVCDGEKWLHLFSERSRSASVNT